MSAQARRDVFQAISDPTRREIIGMIAQQPMNLNAIAEQFDISRPAISNHIKILTQCGMVVITQQGRERYCEAKLEALTEVANWVQQYTTLWNKKFDSLNTFLQNQKNKPTK
ncbi:MAG: ArsR family transcriptional regulator [Sphingobacteriales bacterium]|nr:MAG: ArsR family transcriptional regulator [Sphingobacteriales bacterium]